MVPRLLARGQVHLSTLKVDGQSAAINIGFRADATYFMYQCAMNPELGGHSPGWLLNTMNIRHCIDDQLVAFDFLRGDEPYKSRLSAQPAKIMRYRITAPRFISRLRSRVWSTGKTLKGIGRLLRQAKEPN
jgi:CelD/BcsL family acetyltransferase involved in cellulose biosynthesis